MRASRGMGDINPSKMPKPKQAKRHEKPTIVIAGTKPKKVRRKDGIGYTQV